MSTIVYPAVEVTLASGFANVPPTVFVSYVETVTVRGNPVIRDEHGYSLRVSPDCVRPLGYDATFSIEGDRLVATPVPCEGCGFPPADCECSWHAAYAKAQRLARVGIKPAVDTIECGHCGRTVPVAETSEGMCDLCPDDPIVVAP